MKDFYTLSLCLFSLVISASSSSVSVPAFSSFSSVPASSSSSSVPDETKKDEEDCYKVQRTFLSLSYSVASDALHSNISNPVESSYSRPVIKKERSVKSENLEDCTHFCCTDLSCTSVLLEKHGMELTCYKVYCTETVGICSFSSSSSSSSHIFDVNSNSSLSQYFILHLRISSFRRFHPESCEVGVDSCSKKNEECIPKSHKSRNGICSCLKGTLRNDEGLCRRQEEEDVTTNSSSSVKALSVSVISCNITLPTNHGILEAVIDSPSNETNNYSYEWKSLSKKNSGNMKESLHSSKLELTELVEGVYVFEVTVKDSFRNAFGKAIGSVTVSAPKRPNKKPKARLLPKSQIVTLPIQKAILDASSSSDEDEYNDEHKDQLIQKSLVFDWTIVQCPIGYSPSFSLFEFHEPTLRLDNLRLGNTTVKVRVSDSEGAFDEDTALIVVFPEIDYPPRANAGDDVILYLPQNFLTLSGLNSTDDHEIVSWEWTRSATSNNLTADLLNMRTSNPQVSDLQEGLYTFTLRVFDSSGQSSFDDVNVYVKKSSNSPLTPSLISVPEASPPFLTLPSNEVLLNGFNSTGTSSKTKYIWTQDFGPTVVVSSEGRLGSSIQLKGLSKGLYTFRLTLIDGLLRNSSSSVNVSVTDSLKFIVDAGRNQTLMYPFETSLVLNGSLRNNDLKAFDSSPRVSNLKISWSFDSRSSLSGILLQNQSPFELYANVLDLRPGFYIFRLTVSSEEGFESTDVTEAEVQVKPEMTSNILTITLEDEELLTMRPFHQKKGSARKDGSKMTRGTLDYFLERLVEETIGHSGNLTLLSVTPQMNTNLLVLHLLITRGTNASNTEILSPLPTLSLLKTKLKRNSKLLGLQVIDCDTLLCHNLCSHHGSCEQRTRVCFCEPFWIENKFRVYFGDGYSNCDWSIIYVILVSSTIFLIFCLTLCIGIRKVKKGKRRKTIKTRYKRRYVPLQSRDRSIEMKSNITSSLMESETESDDEIVFENLRDSSLIKRSNGISLRSETTA